MLDRFQFRRPSSFTLVDIRYVLCVKYNIKQVCVKGYLKINISEGFYVLRVFSIIILLMFLCDTYNL